MPHFYIPKNNICSGKFRLEKDESHHLIEVKRCKKGSKIQLFDGEGTSYSAEVTSVEKGFLSGIILEEIKSPQTLKEITLYSAIPKGDRFDWLIEKSAEIGVKSIVPIITQRSVIKEFPDHKNDRWTRLSQAASKQSGRTDIMNIAKPADFFEIVGKLPKDCCSIIPWEAEDSASIKGISEKIQNSCKINIFIGPEGGFTMQEVEYAKKVGLISVSLGPSILRVETAALVSAALCFYLSGGFEKPGI